MLPAVAALLEQPFDRSCISVFDARAVDLLPTKPRRLIYIGTTYIMTFQRRDSTLNNFHVAEILPDSFHACSFDVHRLDG